MSKGLTSDQLAALQLEATRVKVAVEVQTSTPLRYCTGQTAVVIGGNVYTPAPLKLGDVTVGGLRSSEVRVEIADDGSLSSAVYSSGASGAEASIYVLVMDSSGAWSDPVTVFSGRVASVVLDDGVRLKLQITGRVGLRWRVGLHEGSRSCTAEFRGPLCQYAGAETTCNRSWTDCTARSNTSHFRGFRFAPEAGETIDLGDGITMPRPPGGLPSPGGVEPPPASSDEGWRGLRGGESAGWPIYTIPFWRLLTQLVPDTTAREGSLGGLEDLL